MRRSLSVLTSICLVVLSLGLLTAYNPLRNHDAAVGVFGVLDLSENPGALRKPIPLEGTFSFYPGWFPDPQGGEDVFAEGAEWRSHVTLEEALGEVRGGTLRLLVRLPESALLGLQATGLPPHTGFHLNGRRLDAPWTESVGDATPALLADVLGYERSQGGVLDIVLHLPGRPREVSHRGAALVLGTLETFQGIRDMNLMVSSVAQFSLLFLGAYFLFMFLHSRKERFLLYFALFGMTLGLYYTSLNQGMLRFLLPGFIGMPMAGIRDALLTISTGFLLLFVAHLLKRRMPLKWTHVWVFVMLGVGMGVFLLQRFAPDALTLETETLRSHHMVFIALSYLWIFLVFAKVWVAREEGGFYLLPALTAMTLLGGLLILRGRLPLATGHLPMLLMVFLSFSLALFADFRSVRSMDRTHRMSIKVLTFDNIRQDFMQKTARELLRPLVGVSQKVQQILEGKLGPMSLTQQETLLELQQETRRMRSMAEDLLHASSNPRRFRPLDIQAVPLSMLEEFLEEWKYMLPPGKPVTLHWVKPEKPPLVYGEEQRIRQILHHLLKNAVQYTEKGAITVTVGVEKDHGVISVKDTGYGIRKENLEDVFQSFYKEDRKEVPNEEGLGLGLSIARNLAEEMEGRLLLTSELGKGTTVSLHLPLANARLHLEKAPGQRKWFKNTPPASSVRWGPEDVFLLPAFRDDFGAVRVVLVDTDRRMLYKRWKEFCEGPYNLAAFDDPQAMLRYLESHSADLVVMQNRMRNISGNALTEDIRRTYNLLELPVLLLTATGEAQNPMWHSDYGVNETLDRSASKERILSKAESLIQMKKAAEASIQQEISYLHEQITPHFFYNSINTIIGLSYEDADKAREALENLATYFRRKLGFHSRREFVPLSQELELVKAYLSMEELRFGPRLSVTYEETGDLSLRVPALILQPLVENAVFHGASRNPKGGTLHIRVDADSTRGVRIQVRDNGPGISEALRERILAGTTGRVGITNIIKKLRLLKNATFELRSPEQGGTEVEIFMEEVTSHESTAY